MLTEEEQKKVDRGKLPNKGFLRDSVQIWDERSLDWETAWEARFKRQRIITFFNLKALTSTSAYTSDSFFCTPYKYAFVLVNMPDTTGAPTDILIDVEWSDDNANWYKYQNDFYGDLRWEDAGAPYTESFSLPVLAPYIRFKATSQGASSSAYFTLTLKVVFNS